MTTIAVKDGVMACDGRVTQGSKVVYDEAEKMFIHNGDIYGMSGSSEHWVLFKEFISSGEPFPEELDIEVLSLDKDGTVSCITITRGMVVKDPNVGSIASAGSGGGYALAAMRAGATAKEAVEIACGIDIYSGGKVRELKL